MLLTPKKILSELDKIYPNYKFKKEFTDSYITIIKFALFRYFNDTLLLSEDKISFIEHFTYNIRRNDESFLSIYFVDDSIIHKIKDNLINDFNPEHYKIINISSELSFSDEAKLISLFIFDELKHLSFENVDKNIIKFSDNHIFEFLKRGELTEYFKYTVEVKNNIQLANYKFRETKQVRDFLNKRIFIKSNVNELFNSRYLNHDILNSNKLRMIPICDFVSYYHSDREKFSNILVDISKPFFKEEYILHYTNENNEECLLDCQEFLDKDFNIKHVERKKINYDNYVNFFKIFKEKFLNFKI